MHWPSAGCCVVPAGLSRQMQVVWADVMDAFNTMVCACAALHARGVAQVGPTGVPGTYRAMLGKQPAAAQRRRQPWGAGQPLLAAGVWFLPLCMPASSVTGSARSRCTRLTTVGAVTGAQHVQELGKQSAQLQNRARAGRGSVAAAGVRAAGVARAPASRAHQQSLGVRGARAASGSDACVPPASACADASRIELRRAADQRVALVHRRPKRPHPQARRRRDQQRSQRPRPRMAMRGSRARR